MGELTGMVKFKGKVGDIVGYRFNGRNMVRKAKGKNSNNSSPAQERQQARFKELVPVAKAVNDWDKRYLSASLKMSAYNNFLKCNAAYLKLEDSEIENIVFPQSYSFEDSLQASDLSLSGKTLTFTVSAFPDTITEALTVVYVPAKNSNSGDRAFSMLIKTAGVQTFKIPLPLGSGDDVFVFVQGGNGKKDLMPVSVAHIIME
jgi:hypothetical protein